MCNICAQISPHMNDCSYDAVATLDVHDQQIGYMQPLTTDGPATQFATLRDYTNDEIAAQLTDRYWEFQGASRRSFELSADYTLYVDFSSLSADSQFFAIEALNAWEASTGIHFSTATPPDLQVDIEFTDSDDGAYTETVYSGATQISALVNINQSWIVGEEGKIASYAYQTYLHEIGHALGLGHAGNYNGSALYPVDANHRNDSWQNSVMSYFSQQENTAVVASYAIAITPMMADLIAFQDLYGDLGGVNLSDTIYGKGGNTGTNLDQMMVSTEEVTFTIVDNGGEDTIDTSDFSQDAIIDLAAEAVSSFAGLKGNLTIARGTVIENIVTGGGNDVINANAANNQITAGIGDDTIFAGAGDDIILGGAGTDSIDGGAGFDTVDYTALSESLSISLLRGIGANSDTLVSIERAVGGVAADIMVADFGDNILDGNAGDDLLYLGAGSDTAFGGAGSDTIFGDLGMNSFRVTNALATVAVQAGQDTLNGGAGNDVIRAGGGDDIVNGENGADRLFGMLGDDTINGGDDTSADTIFGGGGSDTLFGGAGDDALFGDAGSDTIHGGAGDDTLFGGAGTDTFVFVAETGADVISDWEVAQDTLDLTDFGFASISAIEALASDTATGLQIDLSPDASLLIQSVDLASFDWGDVLI